MRNGRVSGSSCTTLVRWMSKGRGEGNAVTVKSDRIEARLLAEQLAAIDRAAASEGVSRSAFVVTAAVERAERVISAESITRVPASFFDDLVAALDQPTSAPRLARAAKRARLASRIART